MFYWFINHQWKQITRSSMWQKSIAANIGIGFLVLLMFLYLLMLGIFSDRIIEKLYPDSNPVTVFNSFLLYYFAFDLLFRYLMQSLPTLTVEYYRHLPVKKRSLVNYVINKSLLNVINFLPLLVFVPFAFRGVGAWISPQIAWVWLVALILFVLANNYLLTYLKRQLTTKPMVVVVFGLMLIGLVVLDYFGIIELSAMSSRFFGLFLSGPLSLVLPLGWVGLTYFLNYRFLSNRLYPEEISRKKRTGTDRLSRVKYFEGLGLTGEIMMLEMKLWYRHKRTKSMIFMLPIFLLYGFFFYPQEVYRETYSMLIFVGIFMSGGMMMNYLNYSFGYESNYFDGLLTREIDMRSYIRAKFLIGIMITTICFVLVIPYAFFGMDILLINFVTYLFNVGVLSFVLLYMSTYNKKRMDLSKGAAFNYQGVGASNWLVMIPVFMMPVLIYLPFGLSGNAYAGLMFIGILGLIGMIFQKQWLELIYKNFKKRKYTMAQGFRE